MTGRLPRYRRPAAEEQSRCGVSYCRECDLPRLLPVWPAEIADRSPRGRARIVKLIRTALRAERRRGIGGHWTYDLARHAQLHAALRAELQASSTEAGCPSPRRGIEAASRSGARPHRGHAEAAVTNRALAPQQS